MTSTSSNQANPNQSTRPTTDRLVPVSTIVREAMVALEILVPVGLGAFLVSGFVFGWKYALAGGAVAFSLMVLISLPLWLASMEDEIEEIDQGH